MMNAWVTKRQTEVCMKQHVNAWTCTRHMGNGIEKTKTSIMRDVHVACMGGRGTKGSMHETQGNNM